MGEACLVSQYVNPSFSSFSEERKTASWYALKVRSGGEPLVVKHLSSRGLKPYCPTHQERRRYTDRMKIVDKPVFPGYVFCPFEIEKKLTVVSCPGVDYIVSFSGVATPIPDVQMDSVRRLVEAGAVASECCVPGDRVRVTHGPLSGVEGVLVREPRGDRLVVAIELLNQAASLYIGKDHTTIA